MLVIGRMQCWHGAISLTNPVSIEIMLMVGVALCVEDVIGMTALSRWIDGVAEVWDRVSYHHTVLHVCHGRMNVI